MELIPAEHLRRVIGALHSASGDDHLRARHAFKNCTPEEMAQQYGLSGKTRAEILAEYEARYKAYEETIALVNNIAQLPDVEAVSAAVHAAWMETKRVQGVTTRKSESGEELMAPYSDLSEPAKDLDRGTVRTVYAAIKSCLP